MEILLYIASFLAFAIGVVYSILGALYTHAAVSPQQSAQALRRPKAHLAHAEVCLAYNHNRVVGFCHHPDFTGAAIFHNAKSFAHPGAHFFSNRRDDADYFPRTSLGVDFFLFIGCVCLCAAIS